MLPTYSNTSYQSSAPSAHQYAQPNPSQAHSRRHSESACQPQLQQYALAGSPQIANSTPWSYQPPELSPNVRKAFLEQVRTDSILFPASFSTSKSDIDALLARKRLWNQQSLSTTSR
ncbi:hypothetical protein FOTG_18846 [Fusarium oxysporum f. sp. vasinfectum 25433]|uniref:Uncharacterized protein n=1 Tax=Fusarium oxysporum f. sp. vasinfectum 25433 TaxID=1089449 RepID=X0KVG0_FUSOX|nr:hypothetical protein FOTG_18846 [Fusarium oxysporum f. sp. vasinfectum 25433]